MTVNTHVKERIDTLKNSVDSALTRAEYILRTLDDILPEPAIDVTSTQEQMKASLVLRAANAIVNELRVVSSYYGAQLAQIAEEETRGATPIARTHQPPIQRNLEEETKQAVARSVARARPTRIETPPPQAPVQMPPSTPVAAAAALPQEIDPTPHRIPGVVNNPTTPTPSMKVISAYNRFMSPVHSPLVKIFAPSAWLPEGTGTRTVGSDEFKKWHNTINIADRETFKDKVTLPQAFYGQVAIDGVVVPEHVVIRLEDSVIIWNFFFEENCVSIFRTGMAEEFQNIEFLPASVIRSVIEQMCTKFNIPQVQGLVQSN